MKESHGSDGFVLTRWIGLAMVLPALVAVALLGKDALMVVEKINENAMRRETAALERGLKLLGELNAADVLSHSVYDPAFHAAVLSGDTHWMRKNLGATTLAPEGVQRTVVVDGHGRTVLSGADEADTSIPGRTEALLAAAARPMERARELYRAERSASRGLSHRIPGGMSGGVHVNDLIKLDGRPAMLTVVAFTQAGTGDAAAGDEPALLIGAQAMTDGLLRKLETLSHIDGLRPVPAHASQAGAHAHPIADSDGNAVMQVTWNFSLPGYATIKAALPAIALSLALIALMTLVAAFTMRRLTRRLAESEQAAVYASRHDAATGLANRGWFMRMFADLLADGRNINATIAVMLIDCDHFKSVNDTLGHAAGDAVLAAVAGRLMGLSRHIQVAARLGGDEFVVVTTPLADESEAVTRGADIEDALTVPVLFESYVIMVSVSIGGAVLETPSTLSIDTWLARADTALYRAKRDGRGCVRFYDIAEDAGGTPLNQSTRKPASRRPTHVAEEAA